MAQDIDSWWGEKKSNFGGCGSGKKYFSKISYSGIISSFNIVLSLYPQQPWSGNPSGKGFMSFFDGIMILLFGWIILSLLILIPNRQHHIFLPLACLHLAHSAICSSVNSGLTI
jgi:hypothetical protein